MKGREIEVGPEPTPEPFDPVTDIGPPPPHFRGVTQSELREVKFRCGYCGVPCTAAVLPHSPQIAKYKCRRCDQVSEIQTRPSAMDAIEEEFNLRLDMKKSGEHPKEFSKFGTVVLYDPSGRRLS